MSEIQPKVLNEKDAAKYICMSPAFLRRTRITTDADTKYKSTGPAFVRVPGGKSIRYRVCDLDEWLEKNTHR